MRAPRIPVFAVLYNFSISLTGFAFGTNFHVV